VKATIDVTGRPVMVDDHRWRSSAFIEMVVVLPVKTFPPKGYREDNNCITEIILKNTIEDAINFDPTEPLVQ
jgi:hypothetical protein